MLQRIVNENQETQILSSICKTQYETRIDKLLGAKGSIEKGLLIRLISRIH